jgi:hypothetical protein
MITSGLTTSFKEQLMLAMHNLETDVLKIALYTSAASLGPDTAVYSPENESSGAGYAAGGNTLLNVSVSSGQGVGYASFSNPQWPGSSLTARGALIYNSSKSNKSIAVINFGTDQTTVAQTFEIIVPAATPESASIRIS